MLPKRMDCECTFCVLAEADLLSITQARPLPTFKSRYPESMLTPGPVVAVHDHVEHVATDLDELLLLDGVVLLSGLPGFDDFLFEEVGPQGGHHL